MQRRSPRRGAPRFRWPAAAVALVLGLGACSPSPSARAGDVHLGDRPQARPAPSTSTIVVPVPTTASPTTVPRTGKPFTGLIDPSGRPWGQPIAFRSNVPIPDELVFVLVAGSDARPKEDMRRSHADSIHLLAVDPRTRRGTVLGFPRDSWVQVPGHGNRRINDALLLGGPELLARTVEHLTGLPVDFYVLTGFKGLPAIVDTLGGVDIYVEHRMNDGYSGARFKPGWHHMNGEMVLNFSRNRHDVPNGDFSRSENQGKVILAALAKMRAEVANDEGVKVWIDVLLKHAVLDTGLSVLKGLGALARSVNPEHLDNLVLPGRIGMAGKASVVYLDARAAAMFEDLRDDAVIGAGRSPSTHPSDGSTTTSTEPEPSSSTTTEDGDGGGPTTTSRPGASTTTSVVALPPAPAERR